MSFTQNREQNGDIVQQIVDTHTSAAAFLPFSTAQLRDVFTEQEVLQLRNFIADMQEATDDNTRTAAVIAKVDSYARLVVKLLKLTKIIA